MKKICLPLFVALCFAVCLIPSLGMIVRPTTEPIGNERSIAVPSVTSEDGTFNVRYLTELGDYFERRFAFRPEAITADAMIRTGVFGSSNVDTVVAGKNGWLYYASDLDDYLGRGVMSSRAVNAVVQNLSILRDYVKGQRCDFLFTIAPNKSTLYPENMPYYYGMSVSDTHNRDLVRAALQQSDLNYCDLFSLFEEADSTLYFERDSHWNNEGALLAYSHLMQSTGKSYDDYATAQISRRKDFVGDLSKMLYPAAGEAEYNAYYGAEDRYTYVTDTASVEDGYIQTTCDSATGTLYMYRDSFGNALLPFFASAYENATFNKGFTVDIGAELDASHPDLFIMELVERNLDWIITDPPIIPASSISGIDAQDVMDGDVKVSAQTSMYTVNFTELRGQIDSPSLTDDAALYLEVSDGSNTSVYRAYSLVSEDEQGGFLVYVPTGRFADGTGLDISVIMKDESGYKRLGSANITMGEENEND